MLTYTQIDVITMLSWGVWFGVVGGALSGALAGALISPIRTHRFFSFLPGAFRSALPAAAIAVAVSFVAVLLQMAFCKPGHKAGWDVPVWAMSVQAVLIFVAGVVGAFLAHRHSRVPLRRRSVIVWTLVGAFLGALAHLGTSFDGYYVLQSNARPIRHAVIGFLVGGIVALLWRLAIEMLQRSRDESTTSA
jgi:hypothetical protein